jgi:hypothetical protein
MIGAIRRSSETREVPMEASKRSAVTAAALAAATCLASVVPSLAQQLLPGGPEFRDLLIKAVKASPGSLGIETGRTDSGAQVIFAWFENKQALVAWYKSDFHQGAMKAAFPNQTFNREPLPDLSENSGPILALVTLRRSDAAPTAAMPVPIATIGIELYTPLPGGVAVGGRFAPETVKVPGLRRFDLRDAVGGPR